MGLTYMTGLCMFVSLSDGNHSKSVCIDLQSAALFDD